MTKVLNRLEDDRLIVRSHGKVPGDRRAVVIDLTADGEEVIAAIAAGLTSIKPEFRALFTTIAEHPENWSSARRQEIWTAPAAPADPNGPS